MTGVKWTRRTTDKIACELRSGVVFKQLFVAGHKKLCGATSEDRDTQFACIAELRERFAAAGHPIISVDTKKRELKNGGQAWNRADSRQRPLLPANGIAIASTICSRTWVPRTDFAVNAIEKWWRSCGFQSAHEADARRRHRAVQWSPGRNWAGRPSTATKPSSNTSARPPCSTRTPYPASLSEGRQNH